MPTTAARKPVPILDMADSGARALASLTALLATLAGLVPVMRKIRAWMARRREKSQMVERMFASQNEVRQRLRDISSELRSNGGTSLKDVVTRIEEKVELFGLFQRAHLTSSAVALFEADRDGRLTWANPAFLEQVAMTEEEASGSGWVNALSRNEREMLEALWQHTVNERRAFDEPVSITRRDGTEVEMRLRAYPVKSSHGLLYGYLGELRPMSMGA